MEKFVFHGPSLHDSQGYGCGECGRVQEESELAPAVALAGSNAGLEPWSVATAMLADGGGALMGVAHRGGQVSQTQGSWRHSTPTHGLWPSSAAWQRDPCQMSEDWKAPPGNTR